MRGLRSLHCIAVLCLVSAVVSQADDYALVSRTDGDPSYTYHSSPEDWRDVNMYQIFTDRFFDGNSGNNEVRDGGAWFNKTGSNAENDRHLFQGGDWAGVQQKLPYLSGMGVNCIWISGVQLNEQGSDTRFTPYHAYHPHDFYRVEPSFGTFAELKSLIDAAHAQGIYVVLDVVVNHTADRLKYDSTGSNIDWYSDSGHGSMSWWDGSKIPNPFNSTDHYHNHGDIGDSDWDTYPKYVLGSFLGTEDLRTEDPWIQEQLRNIFKHLIDATDCDGFRVDAIKHMEYDFIKGWANDMRQHAAWRGKGNFLLFGEYFSYDDGTQASYCKDNGYSFNSTLWFPMQMTIKNVFAYEQGTTQLADRMNAMGQYGEAADKLVAFIDNHDVDRIALECGSSWEAKLRPALTFLYTALPVPCLFYGTEHGFNQGERRNGSPKLGQADFQRECMMDFGYQWGNAYGDKFYDSPLYLHIQKLNELRNRFISLRRGGITQRWSEGGKGLFAISRVYGDEEALVAINTDWGTKSCNPEVSKPDGTTFVNVLNESETVDVSGGRLSFSVDSKGSKIFVAGPGGSEVNVACDAVTLTITYTPNDGPLSGVNPVYIGIGHDGGLDVMDVAMTPSGDDWTYGYAISNATNWVNFWFHDNGTPRTYDNNGGDNWNIDITQCGQPQVDLSWIGNSYHWPDTNEWDIGEDLWVNTETYPQDAVSSGFVTYSADGGSSWTNMPLSFNGKVGNNDAWHANLGRYPSGTTIQFALNVTGRNTNLWDNNGGGDYLVSVNPGASTVTWIGNTYHWPEDGNIEPGADLWVNIESDPVGAGTNGSVVFSSDGGETWSSSNLAHNGIANDHDLWHVNLGGFPAEATVLYAVQVVDGDGTEHWDNNHGPNYSAMINEAPSSIRWFGNAVQAGARKPRLVLDEAPTGGVCRIRMGQLASNAMYTVQYSRDLMSWSNLNSLTAGTTTDVATVSANGGMGFYRLNLDWAPGPAVYEQQQAVVSIESWPAGGAHSAILVYSMDGSTNWQSRPMTRRGRRGDNDIWSTSLGSHPIGSTFQYAIELKDERGESQWDNNDTVNYQFSILDPSITDREPPTTDYSPHDTSVSNATLDVTLSATDDQDPTPTIYYTTDGSAPTTGSSVYGSAIHVTDQGSGIDMTIKFFARDASGNESGVMTIDVKVGDTFSFGGSKPYSSNPTLGQGVANGSITVDGANNSEWNDSMLIALDMANDDPRSLGSNWTMHEAPIDLTHLWAAWDDNNLYLAWQYADVTDIIDGSNAGGAAGGRINSNDGILQWIAIDTKSGGATHDMWDKNNGEAYWTGTDLPDVQIYMAGSLWQGYLSRAVDGVFPVDDGGVNYFSAAEAGVAYDTGNTFADNELWGVGDADNRHNPGEPTRNFIAEGHDTTRDSFYEISIPLSVLQVTRSDLESIGIGVMLAAGSESAMDSLPHDEATINTAGTETWNSSFEWGDTDSFTVDFVRIGAGN